MKTLLKLAAVLSLFILFSGFKGCPYVQDPREDAAPQTQPTPKPKRTCLIVVNKNGDVTDICPR